MDLMWFTCRICRQRSGSALCSSLPPSLCNNDSVFQLYVSAEPLLFSEGLLLHKLTYVKGDKPTLNMLHKQSLCIPTVHPENSNAPPGFHFHRTKYIHSTPDLNSKWLHPNWQDLISLEHCPASCPCSRTLQGHFTQAEAKKRKKGGSGSHEIKEVGCN